MEDEAFRIQGEKIVAFELDVELIQEDSYEDKKEALFILTDKERIYYIYKKDQKVFKVMKVIDFQQK